MRTSYGKFRKAFRCQPVGLLTLWLAGFAGVLASSCSAGKKLNRQEMFGQQAQLSDSVTRSLTRSLHNRLDAQTVIQWQKITLSPPDTTGRQYPEQILRGTLEHTRRVTQQDTVEMAEKRIREATTKTQAHQQTTADNPRNGHPAWWWLIIGILGGVIWGIKKSE